MGHQDIGTLLLSDIKSNLFESGSEAHIQVKEIKHRETQKHSNTKAHSKKQATIQ